MRKYFYTLIFFVWASSVVWNASHPSRLPPVDFPHFDKVAHTIYYIPGGYFAFLFLRVFGVISVPLSFIFVSSIGFLDEFIQSLVPGREPSFLDIIADFLGAAIGILTARWRSKFGSF